MVDAILRQPRGRFRRSQILKAATAVFLENGYGGATIDLVVARAGASKATIYNFFGGKEGLFAAIVEECSERLLQAIRSIDDIALDGDIAGTLAHIGRIYMDATTTEEVIGIYRLTLEEGSRLPRLVETFFRLGPDFTAAHVADVLAHWRDINHIAVADPSLTASLFLDAVGGDLHVRAALGLPPQDLASLIERRIQNASEIFSRALAAIDPAPRPMEICERQNT